MAFNKQNNKYLLSLVKDVENIYNIFKISISDYQLSDNDSYNTVDNYDKYRKKLKNNLTVSSLNSISKNSSKRFGINIIVDNIRSNLTRITSVVIPKLNYKLINMVLTDLDSLFPKKLKYGNLWQHYSSQNEQNLYNILNDIKNGLSTGNLVVDMENGYIKGLDHSNFAINVDFLACYLIGLTPNETASLIVKNIGTIFSYIEYMTSTTNSTKTLVDTFLKERFSKNKEPIEAIKIASEQAGIDDLDLSTPTKVLDSLDVLTIKTSHIEDTKRTILIDLNREADNFATRIGCSKDLANAIVKIAKIDISYVNGKEVPESTGFIAAIIGFFSIIMVIIATILFSVLGLIFAIVYLTIKLISFVIAKIVTFIVKLFRLLFSFDPDATVQVEDIRKRLNRMKLELIKELRTDEFNDTDKSIIIDQIDDIKSLIDGLNNSFKTISKYSNSTVSSEYDNMEKVSYLTEILEENELHLMKEKFRLKV